MVVIFNWLRSGRPLRMYSRQTADHFTGIKRLTSGLTGADSGCLQFVSRDRQQLGSFCIVYTVYVYETSWTPNNSQVS